MAAVLEETAVCIDPAESRLASLRAGIAAAARLLPAQGPIHLFVHNNTLQALEDLPFEQALLVGSRSFAAEPYWPEARYRKLIAVGRIQFDDLAAVLLDDLEDRADGLVGRFGTRFHLRLSMLHCPLHEASHDELRWYVADSDALTAYGPHVPREVVRHATDATRRWAMRVVADETGSDDPLARVLLDGLIEHFGHDTIEQWTPAAWESFTLHALWRVCHHGVRSVENFPPPPARPVRLRDALVTAGGPDIDPQVHELLIPFCAAFLDQGMAAWPLPAREQGFAAAFDALYGQGCLPDGWLRELPEELAALALRGPLASIADSLDRLGIDTADADDYLAATLVALRGWAGMIWQLEARADRVARPAPEGSLSEFLAVRLVLERLALAHAAEEAFGFRGALCRLRPYLEEAAPAQSPPTVDQRAFVILQLAQFMGWTPAQLHALSFEQWQTLVHEIEAFAPIERRRVLHRAYERHYRVQALDAIAARATLPLPTLRPALQFICCLDDREESLRRHLEELDGEVDGEVETFGAAGFFAVPMYYRGAADALFVPLCPAIIRPRHYVAEQVDARVAMRHERRGRWRRMLTRLAFELNIRSRTVTGGALLTAVVGPLAAIPLVARVISPRWTAQFRRRVGQVLAPPRQTTLTIERPADDLPEPETGLGFTPEERAEMVERLLRDIGLTWRWGRLVVILGHGSASVNNPLKAAYHCAACSGGKGGPNARAFARMANDPAVRAQLAAWGLAIPETTVFLAGEHNTCDESVTLFDVDQLPASHDADLRRARGLLDRARRRNAHERCRRFEAAPPRMSPEAALRHVESRAADLAQTRPELGHATNALCFVGRRDRTRGLFMDRRSFLVSYDPTQDTAGCPILTRILQAAIPVGSGINLDYFFSCIDSTGWGCGTKLPHNITSLVGLMDGAASDLRPGLPSQMVELHEPMRLLFVIEATPDALLQILDANPGLSRTVRNGWVQLAALDPRSNQLHLFEHGQFLRYRPESRELPEVDTSLDWYRGWRDPLGFALVRATLPEVDRGAPRPELAAEGAS